MVGIDEDGNGYGFAFGRRRCRIKFFMGVGILSIPLMSSTGEGTVVRLPRVEQNLSMFRLLEVAKDTQCFEVSLSRKCGLSSQGVGSVGYIKPSKGDGPLCTADEHAVAGVFLLP